VNLVREIRHWARSRSTPICFVSFNYDALLERAVEIVFGFIAVIRIAFSVPTELLRHEAARLDDVGATPPGARDDEQAGGGASGPPRRSTLG
jgi:hypothetical protein